MTQIPVLPFSIKADKADFDGAVAAARERSPRYDWLTLR
jgi:hypothetical protein